MIIFKINTHATLLEVRKNDAFSTLQVLKNKL